MLQNPDHQPQCDPQTPFHQLTALPPLRHSRPSAPKHRTVGFFTLPARSNWPEPALPLISLKKSAAHLSEARQALPRSYKHRSSYLSADRSESTRAQGSLASLVPLLLHELFLKEQAWMCRNHTLAV